MVVHGDEKRCNICWCARTGYFGLSNAFGEDASDQLSMGVNHGWAGGESPAPLPLYSLFGAGFRYPNAGTAQRMLHTGVIQINGRKKNGNEEVFGDDRPCAVLDVQMLSERCRFTHPDPR
jgi:hypothetical protein